VSNAKANQQCQLPRVHAVVFHCFPSASPFRGFRADLLRGKAALVTEQASRNDSII
jgi:hypothetical protein